MVIKKQLTKEEAEVVDFEKIYKFYNSEIGKRMLRSDKINREEPFIIKKKYVDVKNTYSDKSREILVQGIIDSYFYEGEDIVLIDYKTDSLYKKTMENLLHEYRYQIKEYRRALEEITGKKVKESYIYLMSADKFIKVF
jgi:ATP-dependent helicase/nuclease subunit A